MIKSGVTIALYIMTQKGYHCLKYLLDNGYANSICYIVTSEDHNIEHDFYEEIKLLGESNNILVYDRNEEDEIIPDYIIAISWRWLIHKSIVIVLHDSLLPKYRGFAPLVNALLNKEPEIGVTALRASEEYDEGSIIVQFGIQIWDKYPLKIEKAINLLLPCYEKVLQELLIKLTSSEDFVETPQENSIASYSLWLDEMDYRIDWNWTAKEIQQFVYSVGYPYKGALSMVNEEDVQIWDVEEYPDVYIENRKRHLGKVIFMEDSLPVVVCGIGLLKIKNLTDDHRYEKKSLLPLKKFRTRFNGR